MAVVELNDKVSEVIMFGYYFIHSHETNPSDLLRIAIGITIYDLTVYIRLFHIVLVRQPTDNALS